MGFNIQLPTEHLSRCWASWPSFWVGLERNTKNQGELGTRSCLGIRCEKNTSNNLGWPNISKAKYAWGKSRWKSSSTDQTCERKRDLVFRNVFWFSSRSIAPDLKWWVLWWFRYRSQLLSQVQAKSCKMASPNSVIWRFVGLFPRRHTVS